MTELQTKTANAKKKHLVVQAAALERKIEQIFQVDELLMKPSILLELPLHPTYPLEHYLPGYSGNKIT